MPKVPPPAIRYTIHPFHTFPIPQILFLIFPPRTAYCLWPTKHCLSFQTIILVCKSSHRSFFRGGVSWSQNLLPTTAVMDSTSDSFVYVKADYITQMTYLKAYIPMNMLQIHSSQRPEDPANTESLASIQLDQNVIGSDFKVIASETHHLLDTVSTQDKYCVVWKPDHAHIQLLKDSNIQFLVIDGGHRLSVLRQAHQPDLPILCTVLMPRMWFLLLSSAMHF
jgi:hypothetical protein